MRATAQAPVVSVPARGHWYDRLDPDLEELRDDVVVAAPAASAALAAEAVRVDSVRDDPLDDTVCELRWVIGQGWAIRPGACAGGQA